MKAEASCLHHLPHNNNTIVFTWLQRNLLLLNADGDKRLKLPNCSRFISYLLCQEISLNLTYNVISFMNGCITPNNRNSQQWGHSLLAWQVVVRSQPTETFSSTLFIKDFLRKSFLILDLLDVWILFWVSFLVYFFYSFVLSLLRQTSHTPFFSSHPGFLSICALWSLCSSQSFFQLPVSHTAAVSPLSSSLNPPSVCRLWSRQAAIWWLSHER